MQEKEYRSLTRIPAEEQVLWHLTISGKFLFRDVRRILCWPVHKDLRFNLREWISRHLRAKIACTARKALAFVLRQVVGEKPSYWDYAYDGDLRLTWLTEFGYRVHPSDRFYEPEVFGDGSVREGKSQQEFESREPSPDLYFPKRPALFLPAAHPSFRTYLSIEEQEEVLVHLGPQGVCDVLVACFGRGDKVWDELCVRALTESLRRGSFAVVRDGLADDLRLHLDAEFRNAFEEEQLWDVRRGLVPSLLGDFFHCSETTAERLAVWRQTGSFRVSAEREREFLACLRARRPELFAEEEPVVEREPESPSSSGWERATGWE